MATDNRKWFWAAVLAWVLSLGATFAVIVLLTMLLVLSLFYFIMV